MLGVTHWYKHPNTAYLEGGLGVGYRGKDHRERKKRSRGEWTDVRKGEKREAKRER